MKSFFIILGALLFSSIITIEYTELAMNKLYNIETKGEELNYFRISLKNLKVIPNEITIQTDLLNSNPSLSPVLGVYYEPIKLKNYKELLKTKLGEPLKLTNEFIKSSLERDHEIYLTIFSKNSKYSINILPIGDIKLQNNFIQIPFIRNLFEENNIGSNNTDTNNTDTRLDFYGGDGLSALIVAFIMIFVSLIGCGIMMNIYVHTTALVEQPLKLGRIEA